MALLFLLPVLPVLRFLCLLPFLLLPIVLCRFHLFLLLLTHRLPRRRLLARLRSSLLLEPRRFVRILLVALLHLRQRLLQNLLEIDSSDTGRHILGRAVGTILELDTDVACNIPPQFAFLYSLKPAVLLHNLGQVLRNNLQAPHLQRLHSSDRLLGRDGGRDQRLYQRHVQLSH